MFNLITDNRPRSCTSAELLKVGVEIVDSQRYELRCKRCGQHWQPAIAPGGKNHRGYWKCPNGCHGPR